MAHESSKIPSFIKIIIMIIWPASCLYITIALIRNLSSLVTRIKKTWLVQILLHELIFVSALAQENITMITKKKVWSNSNPTNSIFG